jgi:two-component sensor histidine kinase
MSLMQDTTKGGTVYGELAQVYQDIGDLQNSIYYYKKTIVIREKKNPKQKYIFEIGRSVVKLLIRQQKPGEALKFITALEHKHPPDSEFDAGIVAQIKAYCYEALGNITMAEKSYQLMFKGLGTDNNSDVGQIAREDIARFYIAQKQPRQAAFYLEGGRKEEDAIRSKELELMRFKIDSLNGNLRLAIQHYQRYKVINDSIFNSSKTQQIQQLQVAYQTEKKDKDIKLLQSDSLVQKGKLQQANYVRNVTLAGILILILFLAFLYKGYRFKLRKNESLNQLVAEKDGLLVEKDKLLLEKQWLLKEIHHRVKNNLAIVMGLLNRQSAYIDNEVALAAIQNSQNRMRSIALIHQKLYQSECLDLIQMPEYIEELIGHLKDSFDLGSRIIFEKKIAEIYLDVSQAVPLGLIINEAITNSIKYAYPANSTGVIRISLEEAGEGQNILLIKDNGPGLKKGFDPDKIDSLGMNLMKGLSKQLGGNFQMTENNGVQIRIAFKTEVFVATTASVS